MNIIIWVLIGIVLWAFANMLSNEKDNNPDINEKNDNNVLEKQGINDENIMNSDSSSSKSIIFLEGRNGTVSVEKNVIIIRREGVMGFFASRVRGRGDKRIPIKSIISVELVKEPSFMGGISYIRFATAADKEIRVSHFFDPDMKWFENKGAQYFNDP
ncbi:MAG: hypothetical protein IKP66_05795, partial [Lachnospiraceae bacterium]|nr:hypothetical protein [Lachnospiraceae bacterium]